jgi:hypothetical protein
VQYRYGAGRSAGVQNVSGKAAYDGKGATRKSGHLRGRKEQGSGLKPVKSLPNNRANWFKVYTLITATLKKLWSEVPGKQLFSVIGRFHCGDLLEYFCQVLGRVPDMIASLNIKNHYCPK